jgi:hypothetical protein
MAGPEDDRAPSEGAEGQDFHLAKGAGDELKRLASHPVEEAHRLQDDAREGEKGSGLFLLLAEVGIGLWVLAALLIVAVFLIAYFVT